MNLIATALVMGILFLPGNGAPARADSSTTPSVAPQAEDPSPMPVVRKLPEPATTAPTYTVTLTGYNAVPSQTDGDPSTTASGARSNHEVIAARSLDLARELPFGTVVKLTRTAADTPGCNFHKVEQLIGYRVVADTMNARWEKRMDVELDSHDTVMVEGRALNPGIAMGVCSKVQVEVVGRLPLNRIPQTQSELANLYAPHELAFNK